MTNPHLDSDFGIPVGSGFLKESAAAQIKKKSSGIQVFAILCIKPHYLACGPGPAIQRRLGVRETDRMSGSAQDLLNQNAFQ